EADRLATDRLESHTRRLALPLRRLALGIRHFGVLRRAKQFLDERLAATDLHDDRVELVSRIGDAAISDVVAEPTRGRRIGIELRQSEFGDARRAALHQQPAAGPPAP